MTNSTRSFKRILIIRNAYSHDFGGGERMPIELAKELRKHGHKPFIVSRSPALLDLAKSNNLETIRGWWWSFQDWSGVRLVLFPVYLLWQLALTAYYLKLIVSKSIDIVQPQSRDDFISATLASTLLGKKVIWTDHADLKYVYLNNSVWYKNPVGKLVYWASKKAVAVILVSKNEVALIADSLDHKVPKNYTVIYNGVDSAEIEPISKPAGGSDKDAVIFAATSRLVKAKGMVELIKAFLAINPKEHNVRLWLFGEGPDGQMLKDLASNDERVVFWGFPDNSLNYVASADVFVHPSHNEGFSVSLVEAAKLGLPIIACDVGGNPEIVSDNTNGFLIPVNDVVKLQECMETLASDKQLRDRFGKAARSAYQSKFIWEDIVKNEYLKLYEN